MTGNPQRQKRLNIVELGPGSDEREVVRRIVGSYSSTIVRLYSTVRFRVIPLRFLNELAQYMPDRGRVLDLGCGFGLFTLYFAALKPASQFVGVDVSRSRIALAIGSARNLGIRNTEFICSDVREVELGDSAFDTITTLDLLHHLPIQRRQYHHQEGSLHLAIVAWHVRHERCNHLAEAHALFHLSA